MKPHLLTVLIMLSSQTGLAQDEAPAAFQITSMKYQGSGCPQGSLNYTLTEDRKVFTIAFDQYQIDLSGGTVREAMRDCDITFKIQVPEQWSMGIVATEYRGYADLEDKVVGKQVSAIRLLNETEKEVGKMLFVGPYADTYKHLHQIDDIRWSDCDSEDEMHKLRLRTKISLERPRNAIGDGLLTMDSVDGEVQQKYTLAWKKCKKDADQTRVRCAADYVVNGDAKDRYWGRAKHKKLDHARAKALDEAVAICKSEHKNDKPERCKATSNSCKTLD